MEFVKNTWYPVTWSNEVDRSLTRHMIANEPVVVFRRQDGSVAALHDACPHRLAPLSLGTLIDDAIECGYHGMTFDCSGQCIRIPGQEVIPKNATVRAYPIEERYGLVWIWLGDPKQADISKMFNVPQYGQEGWHAVQGGVLRIECNYLSLVENLLDPAHVTFVHKSTLGTPAGASIPVNNEYGDNSISVWRWIPNAPPIPLFANFAKMTGQVDRWHYYDYTPPCFFDIDMGTCATGSIKDPEMRHTGVQMHSCHVLTPVDDRTVLQYWFHVRNFRVDEPEIDQELNAALEFAFKEDKIILERIQQEQERDPNAKQITLGIDAAPRRMHKMVQKLIEEERQHLNTTANAGVAT